MYVWKFVQFGNSLQTSPLSDPSTLQNFTPDPVERIVLVDIIISCK